MSLYQHTIRNIVILWARDVQIFSESFFSSVANKHGTPYHSQKLLSSNSEESLKESGNNQSFYNQSSVSLMPFSKHRKEDWEKNPKIKNNWIYISDRLDAANRNSSDSSLSILTGMPNSIFIDIIF